MPRRRPKVVATCTFSLLLFENHFEEAGAPSSPRKSSKRIEAYSFVNSFADGEETNTDGFEQHNAEFKAYQRLAGLKDAETTLCSVRSGVVGAKPELLHSILPRTQWQILT